MNQKPKILLLEDNPKISEELTLMLIELGYEVCNPVKSYEEAISSFKDNLPDLALCDIKIQGYRDGIQTAKDLKKIKEIPIIYLTAFFEDEIQDRAIATEPAGYLIKPVSFQQLEIALKLALKANKSNPVTVNTVHDYFYICVKGIYEHVAVDEILYLEANNVGTNIVTTHKIYEIPSKTLKKIMEEIPHDQLVRVSRSEAINLQKIKQFDKGLNYITLHQEGVEVKNKLKNIIYVTDSYRDNLKRILAI